VQATEKYIIVDKAVQENENAEENDEIDSVHTVFTSGNAQ
jgi:hypothetical protein